MLHKINSKCALLKQKVRHKHVYYFHLPLLVNEDDYLTAFQSIFLSLFNRSYIVNNLHDLRNERHMHIKQQSFLNKNLKQIIIGMCVRFCVSPLFML